MSLDCKPSLTCKRGKDAIERTMERTRNLPNAPMPSLVIHLMAALVATVAEGPTDPTPSAWMRLLVAKDLLIQPVM